MQAFFYKLLLLNILAVSFFFVVIFLSPAYAASYPTPNNPAIVHVPARVPPTPDFAGFMKPATQWLDGVQYARNNMLSKAAAIGPAERASIETALRDGSIQIKGDAAGPSISNRDPGSLEFEGKTIGQGAQGIEDGLKKLAAEKAKEAPPTPPKPRETGSVNVITKYKVVEGAPSIPPHTCNAQYPGIKFINDPFYQDLPGTEISDPTKMCELAFNIAGGIKAVPLAGVPLVGAGPYPVSPFCQENRGQGTPKKIGLLSPSEGGFTVVCEDQVTPPGGASDSGFGNVPGTGGGGGAGAGGLGAGGLGGGGLGSLASVLPMLMQMLGQGGQGQQGNQQGQNPYGAGYGSQQQNQCAQQSISPVCGADGKTYNNLCYLTQFGTTLKSNGVCVATPTPNPASDTNLAAILSKLSSSGIPANILDTIRNLVASILSNIRSGATVPETVVR